jgi:hypothetical protein
MSKSRINKCRRVGDHTDVQPWFRARVRRNRVRNKMAKESRRINRGH